MKDKKYLMGFDKFLVRSWICVLPLESLAEFIENFSSDLLVTLQGVFYRLPNTDLRNSSKVCFLAALSS